MIIKKPYVFLIKHFREIHIFLLLVGILLYVRHTSLVSFLRDFMEFNAYDASLNPITKYIPGIIIFITLIMLQI